MSDQKFIWIDGTPGIGKTTLIEQVLLANKKHRIAAVRFLEIEKNRRISICAQGNDETERYRAAGAKSAKLIEYRAKDERQLGDFFFCEGGLDNSTTAVLCEGPAPSGLFSFPTDLIVYLIPPLSEPASIFEEDKVVVDENFIRTTLMETIGNQISLAAPHLSKIVGQTAKEFSKTLGSEKRTLSKHTLRREYAGLVRANSVVVPIADATEHLAASELIEFINRVCNGTASIQATDLTFWTKKAANFILNAGQDMDPDRTKLLAKINRLIKKTS